VKPRSRGCTYHTTTDLTKSTPQQSYTGDRYHPTQTKTEKSSNPQPQGKLNVKGLLWWVVWSPAPQRRSSTSMCPRLSRKYTNQLQTNKYIFVQTSSFVTYFSFCAKNKWCSGSGSALPLPETKPYPSSHIQSHIRICFFKQTKQ